MGRGRHLYPARPRLINNFVTGWGENTAETTAGKLWSPEMSFVVDTSARLGAQGGYPVVVDFDSSQRISLNRLKGIAQTGP